MNRKLTGKILEIISFILFILLIIMVLTAWNSLNQEIPLFYGIDGRIILKGSKFFALVPLLVASIFFISSHWLKNSKYLTHKIQGRDTLESYELKAELLFELLTIRVDLMILAVLFELSMIASLNLTSSLILMLLMTCIVIGLTGKFCNDHKINLLF